MKPVLRLFVLSVVLFATHSIHAQYCTPSLTTTGVWLGFAGFGPPYGSITGGSNHNSSAAFGSEGYVDRSGTSSGTVSRGCSNSYFYSVQSCGNVGPKNFNFRIYADWNQDNDFDDANEMVAQVSNTVISGNCAFYNSSVSIVVPLTANSGTIRMRWALRENGTATACGGYTGEIEDYSVTITNNNAPVLNNAGIPILNPLTETQTDNSGISIGRFIKTTEPGNVLITEADACTSIKGIALIGTSGSNGTWQYKLANGSWTDVGVVSSSNALLLNDPDYIRFVPSGAGTAGITFRAWDRTVSSSGSYYNITATGGTTAFSDNSETAELTVYSTAAVSSDETVYMAAFNGSEFNLLAASLGTSGTLKHLSNITNDNTSGFGYDIALDQANNKLYWIGGTNYTDLMRSNTDGTDLETLITGVFGYSTGIAIGGNKIFINDYGIALYSADMDGSNLTAITGGAGQATDIGDLVDMEYYGGKIYYINQPGYTGGYKIFEADPDGTNTVELLTLDYYPFGLDVVNGTLYWTETDGSTGYIRSRAISGGLITDLATEPGRVMNDLMVNPSLSKIYFTEGPNSGNDPYIKSIPLTGGAAVKELVLEENIFSLVFSRSLFTLPVHFTNVKAWPQDSRNVVEWNIADEVNVGRYTIERSADGRDFTDAGVKAATQSNRYQWTDAQPLNGNNYYRIRATDIDGKQLYSAVVLVSRIEANRNISVYPTVTTGKQVNLRLQNLLSGAYQLRILNDAGQQVYIQRILHSGGSSVQSLELPAAISKGVYRMVINNSSESYTTAIVIR